MFAEDCGNAVFLYALDAQTAANPITSADILLQASSLSGQHIRQICSRGVAAASPSIWFPGFLEYMKDHETYAKTIYLSLGDKESKARNPVMAAVANRIRDAYDWLKDHDVSCTLEWNPGNHFRDPAIRTAKAFVRVMDHPAPVTVEA